MMRTLDAEFHDLPLCDDEMTFYYDETGNCRLFRLTEDGVNNESALESDFILGGIAYDGSICPADADVLFQLLKLQPSIKELKFHHINRSNISFLQFMGDDKVTAYINWLHDSKLYIHYATINNLYYGLVDLVDSLLEVYPKFYFDFEWLQYLKSELYRFCKEHFENVHPILYKYHFPNIARENTKSFCLEFCELIRDFNDDATETGFGMEVIRQMLKHVGKYGEMPLLHDNDPDILVNEYYSLYSGRCYTYKNAHHYFDREDVVKEKMDAVNFVDDGKPFKNYDFIDSLENRLIQVSDVFVGVLGRVFKYLDSVSEEDIRIIDREKNAIAIMNLQKLNELIIRSDKKHPMLIQNVNDTKTTMMRMKKLELLVSKSV